WTWTWIAEPAWLKGWGWSDVERYLLVSRLRLRGGSLVRLGDVIDLDAARAKTVDVVAEVPGLESDDVRPDWYLALPTMRPVADHEHQAAGSGSAHKRFFEVRGECLLIPPAGNITAAPVVLPGELFSVLGPPVMVPIYWLPLVKLTWPRALAVV